MWSQLDHPNLLSLSGYYIDPQLSFADFICPFYAHGHLGQYIEEEKPDKDIRLKLVSQIAFTSEHSIEVGSDRLEILRWDFSTYMTSRSFTVT